MGTFCYLKHSPRVSFPFIPPEAARSVREGRSPRVTTGPSGGCIKGRFLTAELMQTHAPSFTLLRIIHSKSEHPELALPPPPAFFGGGGLVDMTS